jgi:hypothetical protein
VAARSDAEQLERLLLERGLGVLEDDRCRCSDCGRTPLVGEQMHLYEGRKQLLLCDLCRQSRREPPLASELVRHCERGHAVRLRGPETLAPPDRPARAA